MYLPHPNDKALAQQILDYSVAIKPEERIMLQLIGLHGIPLLHTMAKEVRKRRAYPFIIIEDEHINHTLIDQGDKNYWKDQRQSLGLPLMKKMDAYVGIRARKNSYENHLVDKDKINDYNQHFSYPVHLKERVEQTRWCILNYPSPSLAMSARQSTEDFYHFYYQACLFDYQKLAQAIIPLKYMLENTDEIYLKGKETDIRLSVKNQPWISCTGTYNLPDGEIFTSPIRDSIEGVISYIPTIYQGHPFEHIKLWVKKGKVVKSNSSDNRRLDEILDLDEGARGFGEFSFGLNPVIRNPINDILFDEKMYGSNHLTLGQCYKIAPNGNHSQIHWDLICIDTDIWLDGVKIREGGCFIHPELTSLNY